MNNSTGKCYLAFAKAALFVVLFTLSCGTGAAQSLRGGAPNPGPGPVSVCSPTYRQAAGATYVAANHLTGSFGPADLGVTGATTTVDASWYGGTVVFSGTYRVRGNVRFANGTAELRPGTVFYVEGLNGQTSSTTAYPYQTVIEVDNASL